MTDDAYSKLPPELAAVARHVREVSEDRLAEIGQPGGEAGLFLFLGMLAAHELSPADCLAFGQEMVSCGFALLGIRAEVITASAHPERLQ